MVKKACYIIVPNGLLFQKYGNQKERVFKDPSLKWKEVDFVSGYWGDLFDTKLTLNYQGVLKKLSIIVVELMNESCSFHLDKHKFYCDILHNMKIGETVFIKYEEETKLVLQEHLKTKYSKMVQLQRNVKDVYDAYMV